MTFRIILLLCACFLLSHTCVNAVEREACVLNQDKRLSCEPSNLNPLFRISEKKKRRLQQKQRSGIPHTPSPRRRQRCATRDAICWNRHALSLTNKVRRKNGVKEMLLPGTQAQLDNAMRYAKFLARLGFLKHQVLSAATKEVRCKRFVSGENIAFHYETDKTAERCVELWVRSRGHFLNLIRGWFREMVMGIYIARDGRVYCVQTFALYYPTQTFGNRNGPKCYPARRAPL